MAIIKTTCACDRCGTQSEMSRYDYHPGGWKEVEFRVDGRLTKDHVMLCSDCIKHVEAALAPIPVEHKCVGIFLDPPVKCDGTLVWRHRHNGHLVCHGVYSNMADDPKENYVPNV